MGPGTGQAKENGSTAQAGPCVRLAGVCVRPVSSGERRTLYDKLVDAAGQAHLLHTQDHCPASCAVNLVHHPEASDLATVGPLLALWPTNRHIGPPTSL